MDRGRIGVIIWLEVKETEGLGEIISLGSIVTEINGFCDGGDEV